MEQGTGEGWLLRLGRSVLRWRYAALVVAAFGFSLHRIRGRGVDWPILVYGSRVLASRGGLHLYARYPSVTMGPLSLVATGPFRMIGPGSGRVSAVLAMTAVAPCLVWTLEQTAQRVWSAPIDRELAFRYVTVLFGGLMLMWSWSWLATVFAHLDDVLTLTAVVAAMWAVASRRPVVSGIALGLAIATKPWGILFLPLAFALPGRWRWKALAIAVGIACVAWGPFVLADPKTVSAMHPQVGVVAPESVMHLLGVAFGRWTRPAQFGCALIAGSVAVWRGRWAAVPLVAIAIRLAFDPQVYPYYGTGVVVAALAWDLLRARRPLPIWTLSSFVFIDIAPTLVHDADAEAALRLLFTVGVLIAVLALPRRATLGTRAAIGQSP